MNLSSCLRDARPAPVKRGRWLTGTALCIAAWAMAGSALAQAQLPGTVNSTVGGVTFGTNNGTSQTITQTTQRAIINWNDFNIANGQTLTFDQQLGASSIILNRVTGGTATSITGTLNANGQVWILNPNGLLVGSTGRISARGFLGATGGVTDNDFTDGNSSFNFTGTGSTSIVNYGEIKAGNGGYAVLAGQQVDNNSLIQANLGRVVLAGVPAFTIDIAGDSLLSFAVDESMAFNSAAAVNNGGVIQAQGGKVLMTARAAAGLAGSVVNLQGLIEAQTASVDGNGQVVLSGTGGTAGDVALDGGANATLINGFVDQNGARAGGVINVNSAMETDAGAITVLGNSIDIGLTQQAKLLASGVPGADGVTRANGGTISIGRGLANTAFANAPLASRINIGSQSSSNFDRSVDPNGFPIVEIQARAFGGTGRSGGRVYLYTQSASPTAQINTSGFIDVQASGDFQGNGGLGGLGGLVEVVTHDFTLKPSGTIIANSVTSAAKGGGGGTGGSVKVAGQRLVTQGDADAPFDTRISASGNIQGGDIYFGAGAEGSEAVAGQPVATEIWVGANSSFRASAGDLSPGSMGGNIVIRGATDGTGSSVYIDGGLSARGGHGGYIETVGQRLQITGAASDANIDSVKSGIDAGGYAAGGTNGIWYISGRNLTVKGVVTAQTPDFLGGTGDQAIDGRVLGGALGAFVHSIPNDPTSPKIYGATDVDLSEGQFGLASPTKLSVLGPVSGGGERDATLTLSSDDEIDITGAITAEPSLSGKLDVLASAGGLIRFRDDGLQGSGVRSILTNGGHVSLTAAEIVIGTNRSLLTGLPSGNAGDISLVADSVVALSGGAQLDASSNNGAGGHITLLGGNSITIGDLTSGLETRIAASGTTAGSIDIGGGIGGAALSEAGLTETIVVNPLARIEADGFGIAEGGTISIWSDRQSSTGSTIVLGKLYARSGLQGGDGGVVEIGGRYVLVEDNARLDATASRYGGNVRLLGTRIDLDTNLSTETNPVGIFAWGIQGGGEINIGGGSEGGTTDINMGPASRLNANAIETGPGGTITVMADEFDSASVLLLGGSLVASSPDGLAGVIDVRGADVQLGTLSASAMGDQGSIRIYESGYGDGYGVAAFAEGGQVTLAVGTNGLVDLDGAFETNGGALTIGAGDGSNIHLAGFIATSGGNFSLAAGASADIDLGSFNGYGVPIDDASIYTGGGDFSITAASGSLTLSGDVFTGDEDPLTTGAINVDLGTGAIALGGGEFGSYFDAGTGNVRLSASSLSLGFNGYVYGTDIHLLAENMAISGYVAGDNSITVATLTANRNLSIGGYGYGFDGLELTDLELDNLDAPTTIFGRADGTGAVTVFVTPGDFGSAALCEGSCVEVPSTTIVQSGGVGGTITVSGQGSTDPYETVRLIAGSGITFAGGLQLEVNGKLEVVSGGSFVNNAGASALTTVGDGQWLIYSTAPAFDVFGGLVSGQTALWGRSYADVAANGIAHGGNQYAFGLSPTLTIAATSRSKTYGDTLDLSSAVLGRDYQVAGLIDAAAYGNVFTQDSLTGSLILASGGSGAAADAGAYAIGLAAGSDFAAPEGYSVSLLSGTLTVNRRLLTASLANASKVYDGTTAATLGATSYSLAGLVNGDDASVTVADATGAFDNKNVGTGKLVTVSGLALTGAKAGNYELSSTTLSGAVGTITPKTLTGALVGTTSKVYDSTTAATLSAANYRLAGFIDGESGAVSGASGTYGSPNVGSNLTVNTTLTAASFTAGMGTDLSNYQLPMTASGAIGSITPATLTYVANPVSRDRGTANPPLTGSVTGFVGGEIQGTATSGTLAFTTTATAASPAGNYAINGGGLSAGNYVFTQAAGNAAALQVNEGAAPIQQVMTSVIQQLTTATRLPAPATPPPAIQPPASETGSLSAGTSLARNPPPPLPPLATIVGSSPSAAGPGAASMPPSPVANMPPETPSDAADQGDPVLAEAEPEADPSEAPSKKRRLANTTTLVPGLDIEVPVPPRSTDVPGAEQSFSGSGNPAQW